MAKPQAPKATTEDQKEPGPRNRAAINAAVASNKDRPIRASVGIECNDDNTMELTAPHSDADGWATMLNEAFGTVSNSFTGTSMASLEWMTRGRKVGKANDVTGLNAALAFMGAVAPQDELEAALAMQMAGCHSLSVEMLAMARQADRTDHVTLYGNLAVKLQRTFTAQIEALARLRGGANQSVRVEHVHVHPGGQAIVGNVEAPGGGGRGKRKSQGQPDAKAENDAIPALRSPDAQGNGVPIAGGVGAEAVPDARRH
jgi:hypothetical protein